MIAPNGVGKPTALHPPIGAPTDGRPITRGAFCLDDTPYRQCRTCVMDSTDPDFVLFDEGDCNNCRTAQRRIRKLTADRDTKLDAMLEALRSSRPASEYDCIIGVSGGVDSSSCVVFAAEHELKALIVHVDAGWNSSAAVSNVEQLCTTFGFDLETIVIDWEQLRSLQVAFLRSGVANQDTPQDHVLFGALYRTAQRYGIPHVIEGRNWQTECILPAGWGHAAMDSMQIRAIARRFGAKSIAKLPIASEWEQVLTMPRRFGLRIHAPLIITDYDSQRAKHRLVTEFGWSDYGGKHHESRWTRFFQNYLLPFRFGYDKRKAHLSSRICSGEITRNEALVELTQPLYADSSLHEDLDHVRRKLNLHQGEFDEILLAPLHHFTEYPNHLKTRENLKKILRAADHSARAVSLGRGAVRRVFRTAP